MPSCPAVTHQHGFYCVQRRIRTSCFADVPAMVPTMVKLPGQSRSMVQLLPPPSDPRNPLTAVELARSAEVSQAPFSAGVMPLLLLHTFASCLTWLHCQPLLSSSLSLLLIAVQGSHVKEWCVWNDCIIVLAMTVLASSAVLYGKTFLLYASSLPLCCCVMGCLHAYCFLIATMPTLVV